MKLWEIKAQSLRIMFADSDIQFSYDEFENGTLYDNANTRDKLVRMNDSIKRAIDSFYQFVGTPMRLTTVGLKNVSGVYYNVIQLSDISDFGTISRIAAIGNSDVNMSYDDAIEFFYDSISKTVVPNSDYSVFENGASFNVYYFVKKTNLPDVVDELTFDLNTLLNIPEDVQRMIPYFVKGELYEEDEYSIALQSKNIFQQFLLNYKRQFANVQTKVKRANVFNK